MNLFDDNAAQTLVEQANDAYYNEGEPILSDQEFDLLSDTGLETRNFRKKVEHYQPMGSLSKHKESESFARWLRKHNPAMIVVLPKLDGSSQALSGRDGRVTRHVTRGDGYYGSDISVNASYTNTLKKLPASFPPVVELRAEAIIPRQYQEKFEKNIRNVASGKLGAKDPQPDVLSLIDMIVFDIHTENPISWNEKKALLKSLPKENRVDFVEILTPEPDSAYAEIKYYFDMFVEQYRYLIDGLVVWAISDPDAPLPQAALDPVDKCAVKYDGDGAETTIIGHEWNLGKHSKLTPVLLLDSVQLDGTKVSRASASNYSLLKSTGLGVGAVVSICKKGEIIPGLKMVISPSGNGLELPLCPACETQSVLSESGVDALCPNLDCEGKTLNQITKAFEIFSIEFVSDKILEKLVDAGYDSLEALFSLTVADLVKLDGFAEKSATYFVNSLKNITLSEAQVFKLLGLRGLGERKGIMLLDFYGSLEAMIEAVSTRGLDDIANFGPKQAELLNKRINDLPILINQVKKLGINIVPHRKEEEKSDKGMVICCTGTCPGYTRSQLSALLERHGHTFVDRFTSDTQMVICADPSAGTKKLKKARDKGLPIRAYGEFLSMLGE